MSIWFHQKDNVNISVSYLVPDTRRQIHGFLKDILKMKMVLFLKIVIERILQSMPMKIE